MGLIQDMDKIIKKQPGRRYRLVRMDPANVSDRIYKGYEFVVGSDPEIKDTPLDRHKDASGQIRVGGLALAKISEKRARELEAARDAKLEKRMKAIREGYLREGENIKRKLGSAHKAFDTIVEEEKD